MRLILRCRTHRRAGPANYGAAPPGTWASEALASRATSKTP